MHTIPSVRSCSEWGLPSQPVTWLLVSSYLTISPLPDLRGAIIRAPYIIRIGRYVSVALSLRSPSLDVIQHPALWSSDFPRTYYLASCLTCAARSRDQAPLAGWLSSIAIRDCLSCSNPPHTE